MLSISRMVMLCLQAGLKQDDSARACKQVYKVLSIRRMRVLVFTSRIKVLTISRMIMLY